MIGHVIELAALDRDAPVVRPWQQQQRRDRIEESVARDDADLVVERRQRRQGRILGGHELQAGRAVTLETETLLALFDEADLSEASLPNGAKVIRTTLIEGSLPYLSPDCTVYARFIV